VVAGYAIRIYLHLLPMFRKDDPRIAYRSALVILASMGQGRRFNETPEEHARRLGDTSASLSLLTHLHLRNALGNEHYTVRGDVGHIWKEVRREIRTNRPYIDQVRGWCNPFGWWRAG